MVERCCPDCGIAYGVPATWLEERKKDGVLFYCPNGHGRYFPRGKSEAYILKEKLAASERREQSIRDQRDAADRRAQCSERRRRAQKAVATKLRKRAVSA